MPDTVLPSPGLSSGGTTAPRMGTPANDSSWTGWAISSFTNKLAAASGQMQASTNGSSKPRPASVPPPAVPNATKPTITPSARPGMTLTKSTTSVPSIVSPDPAAAFNDEAEDFSGDWGGFGDDGFAASTTNKKDEEEDPWGTPSATTTSAPKTTFDDQGEPDFAGWLAAQSQSKKPLSKPLPKGLAKSTPVAKKPIVGGKTTSNISTKKVIVAPKKGVKKDVQSNEDEEDGWGDAW